MRALGGLAGRDIVCFANDWDGDPLSKKHIMQRLARRNRVLWVESLGQRPPRLTAYDGRRIAGRVRRFARGLVEVERNIWVLTPMVVPLYGSRIAAELNARLVALTVRAAMARLGYRRAINYSFHPASAWVAGRLGEARVIYHCVDEYGSFAGAGEDIRALEERLLRRSDLVIVCSEPLLARKRALNPRTVLVRHGVDHAHFARALDPATEVPPDMAWLPRPVIGFHGLIAEWIDLGLIRRVADAYPSASVVLVGERRVDAGPLRGAGNVHLLGRRPYAALPGYCRGFDVAMLPFTVDDLTIHANPLKLREYLAAGLPVVATRIPEAEALVPQIRVAGDGDEFVRAVGEALREQPGPLAERSARVAGETWDDKVREIEERIAAISDGSGDGGVENEGAR
jgi:glycosyltransferase involved in cell wall biosynthesis